MFLHIPSFALYSILVYASFFDAKGAFDSAQIACANAWAGLTLASILADQELANFGMPK